MSDHSNVNKLRILSLQFYNLQQWNPLHSVHSDFLPKISNNPLSTTTTFLEIPTTPTVHSDFPRLSALAFILLTPQTSHLSPLDINGGLWANTSSNHPQGNGSSSLKHYNPAPFWENPGKEKSYRSPKERAPQAFPALLHLLSPRFHGSSSVHTSPMPPLLGTHHFAFPFPSYLLRFSGPDLEVHQWVQVPEKVPQADSWPGYW